MTGLLIANALALLGATITPVDHRCPVTDLMPVYWKMQARKASFKDYKAAMTLRYPTIYKHDFVNALEGDAYSPSELAENRFVDENAEPAKGVSRVLAAELPQYIASFQATFGQLRCDFPIFIAPSFGHMDAAASKTPDGLGIVFSPATILRFDGDRLSTFKLLFDHELFHIYHAQASKGAFGAAQTNDAPIYASLWSEGLAVYVSQRLNAGMTRERALLDTTLAAQAEPFKRALAQDLLENMDSRDPVVFQQFFTAGRKKGAFPARAGYFIGAIVAEDLARTRSLEKLAALSDLEVHTLIRECLEALASPRQ